MLNLKNIRLSNFRCHTDTAIPYTAPGDSQEAEFGDVLVLVGKNDIGKSSVLKALDLFFNSNCISNDDIADGKSYSDVVIDLKFNDGYGDGSLIHSVVDSSNTIDSILTATLSPVPSLADYKAYFVYKLFSAEDYYDSSIDDKYIKDLVDNKLDTVSEGLKKYLSPVVGFWKEIFGEYYTKDTGKIEIRRHGTGLRRLCSLFNYTMDNVINMSSTNPKKYIFALEEPEISLYPEQQRLLVRNLIAISNFADMQFIITTHSPYIVNELKDYVSSIVPLRNNNGVVTSDVLGERLITSYFSLNEINYLAFEEASIEYHQELLNKIEYEWAKMSTGGLMKDIVWAVSKYDTGVSNYIADLVAKFKADYGEIINPYKGNEYHWQDNDKILYDECICSCVRNAIDHTWEGNEHWKSQKYVELSLKIMIAVAPKMKIVIDSVVNNLTNANWVSLDGGTKKYNIDGETIKRPKCKFLRKIHKFFFKKDILFRNKNYCIVFKYKYPERTIWDDKERELDRVTMADVYKALSNSTNLFK